MGHLSPPLPLSPSPFLPFCMHYIMWRKALFILLIIFIVTPFGSPPLALALGLAMALTIGNPFPDLNGKPTRMLLQTSVILLGFGMNLKSIYEAGKDGILLTI